MPFKVKTHEKLKLMNILENLLAETLYELTDLGFHLVLLCLLSAARQTCRCQNSSC